MYLGKPKILQTAGEPVNLKLSADRYEIFATGQDLCYVVVELLDENGLRNPATDNLVRFEIEGPGEIIAVASSNPMSTESFQQAKRKAYKGRCLVIIKSEKETGEIRLLAKSKNLESAELRLIVK